MSQEIIITEEDRKKFKRLDAFLVAKYPHLSRSLIKKYFDDGVFESKSKIELKKMPIAGTSVFFHEPIAKDTSLEPQNIPLEILYEDEFLLIINKQAGLVVHPAPGNPDQTLVNAILWHCPDLKGIGNEKRPGIVHRLDKGTSGIMVVAKEQKTHEGLVELFREHDIQRKYQAICLGNKIQDQTIESTIGRNPQNRLKMKSNVKNGKNAITHLKVLEYFNYFSHVELTLETGRTHQIRVHLSQDLNSPILNDHTYGRNKEEKQFLPNQIKGLISDYEYPFLHAKILGFTHPITKKELFFEANPPTLFSQVLEGFRQ